MWPPGRMNRPPAEGPLLTAGDVEGVVWWPARAHLAVRALRPGTCSQWTWRVVTGGMRCAPGQGTRRSRPSDHCETCWAWKPGRLAQWPTPGARGDPGMVAPSAEATSSTASAAVSFSRSRIGFTFDDLERVCEPGFGDQLHRQVRLAVGGAAAGQACRRLGRTPGRPRPCPARRGRTPGPAMWASDSRMQRSSPSRSTSLIVNTLASSLAVSVTLAVVEGADADERDAARLDHRELPRAAREEWGRSTEQPRRAPSRERSRSGGARGHVEVPVRVNPEGRRRGPNTLEEPPSVPIATEWSPPRTSGTTPPRDRVVHPRRDPLAGRLHLGQVAAPTESSSSTCSTTGAGDVALVGHLVAERAQPRLEPRVADRRRPHVDAAAALPEVEGGPDDGDAPRCRFRLRGHGRRPAARLARSAPWRGSSVGRALG